MNDKLQQAVQTIIPYFLLGVGIAIIIGLLLMFSYLLLWGIFIGAVLWVFSVIKSLLFPKKELENPEGRIIEHQDRE